MTLLTGLATAAVAGEGPPSYGRIVGHITKSTGEPVVNAVIWAEPADNEGYLGLTRTDQNGDYVIKSVRTWGHTPYKIHIDSGNFNNQWAHQKTSAADAEAFIVAPGNDTVVNDVLLPTGSMIVTVTDSVTGVRLQKFCASVGGPQGSQYACTESGQILFIDLRPGQWTADSAGDDLHMNGYVPGVSVAVGQTVATDIKVDPAGAIDVTTVDATTHEPVANVCVSPAGGNYGPNPTQNCTAANGKSRIASLPAGTYQIFVNPKDATHGSQWVGVHGGTGNQPDAQWFDVHNGQITTLPVLLDGAGTITGTVTDKLTGQPIKGICVAEYPVTDDGRTCTDANGKYVVNNVGPYSWPVNFVGVWDGTYALQWSGDKPIQRNAARIQVHTGQSTTLDQGLIKGATVTGQVVDQAGNPVNGTVEVVNADTGDYVGVYGGTYNGNPYIVRGILGPQLVKLGFAPENSPSPTVWTRPVFIRPGGTETVTITVP